METSSHHSSHPQFPPAFNLSVWIYCFGNGLSCGRRRRWWWRRTASNIAFHALFMDLPRLSVAVAGSVDRVSRVLGPRTLQVGTLATTRGFRLFGRCIRSLCHHRNDGGVRFFSHHHPCELQGIVEDGLDFHGAIPTRKHSVEIGFDSRCDAHDINPLGSANPSSAARRSQKSDSIKYSLDAIRVSALKQADTKSCHTTALAINGGGAYTSSIDNVAGSAGTNSAFINVGTGAWDHVFRNFPDPCVLRDEAENLVRPGTVREI